MDRYDSRKMEYLRRGMTHRKIAFALSVLLVCVNIGLSYSTIVARADEPVFSGNSINDVSGNTVDPIIIAPTQSDPSVSDNAVSDNNDPGTLPAPSEDPTDTPAEEPGEEVEEVPTEEPEEEVIEEPEIPEETQEEIPAEESEPVVPEEVVYVEPEPIANTDYEAVAYQEIAEYFLEPAITQVDRDAEYEDGVYYAEPNGCYYFFVANDANYLVCRYDGGQHYIQVKNGIASWDIPDDFSGKVSFGYEGTEGTYRELFSEVIFNDTTAPVAVMGMDESYQSQLRIEISEVGTAKSGIKSVTCTVDGKPAELENLTSIQKSTWRGQETSLVSLATYRDEVGTHEITLTVTDLCGNVSETTESFEIVTNGMICVTLPGSFIIPMMYDYEDGAYLFMANKLEVVNNGDAPLDVKITNVTVSVDKTLPTTWPGKDSSEAIAAAARKTVDATLCITTDAEGRSSHHLKEGLNREGITFTLDPKSEDGTSNIAYIQFTGSTGTGDPALWENGDFVVHMTFQFSIHRDPDQDRAASKLKKASDLNTSLQDAGLNTAPSDPEPVLTSETIPDSETPLASAPSEAFKTTVLERDSGPGGGSVSENDLIDLP